MAFKNKTKNRNPINIKKTLDATHSEIIDIFQLEKNNLESYHQTIKSIEKSIENIKRKPEFNKNIPDFNIQKKIWKLEDQKTELENKIESIESNKEEHKYLLETGNIMKNYYRIINGDINNLNIDPSIINKPKEKKIIDTKRRNVLDYLENNTSKNSNIKYNLSNGKQKVIFNDTKDKQVVKREQEINKITQDFSKEINNTKQKLYNKYMSLIEDNYIPEDSDEEVNYDCCNYCLYEMKLNQNTGILICDNCGIEEQIIIDSDKPSYKDPPKEITSFCYKRINHLNEFLAQFQAKETTDIPEEIYNEILLEIKKERIINMVELTPDKLRILLKKIKRNDYYEHVPYIINQLNGLPPPIISSNIEEVVRSMFKEIQIPFEKHRPKGRKNFLSYNYVMYKFFELLELDEYIHCFQLLKSRNKLHQQDMIWKNICNDLQWQYIPSL
jgi:hypothetical protein